MNTEPLTPEHKRRIDDSLKELDELEHVITKAKQSGIDVQQQEAQLKENRDKLRKIKRVWFPNK
jgi:hypothetical protein